MAGYPRLFGNSLGTVVTTLRMFFTGLTGGKWDMWLDTLKASTGVITDTISERTATAGVTIDTCLIKDGVVANSDKLDGEHGAFYQTATAILTALSGLTWSTGSPLVKMTAASSFGLDSTAYITLLSLSCTATGLTYTNTTGAFSWTSGYCGTHNDFSDTYKGYLDQSVKQADGPTFDHIHIGTTRTIYFD